ncbi:cell division protein SepF [Candidatus Soleaferrea massiliensis]|uniref:cell division protein SepF n=1 Tax=Candidatus Soleaferrea massiliensis TaxID=1470354 RepID=UPI000590535C|nr:cell division protein SepF [Candidatus Soleaferrea massiliensis]
MSFFNKLFGNPDDEFEEETVDEIEEKVEEEKPAPSFSEPARNRAKITNIHPTTQLQVVLVKPERFEEASSIADHLNAKKTVVLNLEAAGKDTARRLIDFLSGVAYANNGQVQKVSSSTFIITAHNVDLMGEILDEIENGNLYY